MKRLTTSFETHQYEFAHGKRPSGGAGWAFEVNLSVHHVERLANRVAELLRLAPEKGGMNVEKNVDGKPALVRIWTGPRKYGEAKTLVRHLLEDVVWDAPAGATLFVEVCS